MPPRIKSMTKAQLKPFAAALRHAQAELKTCYAARAAAEETLARTSKEIPRLEGVVAALGGKPTPASGQSVKTPSARPAGREMSPTEALALVGKREVPEGAGFVASTPEAIPEGAVPLPGLTDDEGWA